MIHTALLFVTFKNIVMFIFFKSTIAQYDTHTAIIVVLFFYVYWTVHHCYSWRIKDQLEVTCYSIQFLVWSTCFGH